MLILYSQNTSFDKFLSKEIVEIYKNDKRSNSSFSEIISNNNRHDVIGPSDKVISCFAWYLSNVYQNLNVKYNVYNNEDELCVDLNTSVLITFSDLQVGILNCAVLPLKPAPDQIIFLIPIFFTKCKYILVVS